MSHEQMERAAHNNAVWCDTVCRTHGNPGTFLDSLWINRRESPRYYPNVVTLSTALGTAVQLAAIQELATGGLPREWGVKDSFCVLDLAGLGFRLLFEAQWVCRAPSLARPNAGCGKVDWVRIHDASGLAHWETAWSRDPTDSRPPRPSRIFLPTLLVDENVAVLAAYQGQRIVGGAVANRTVDVVGVSNIFAAASDTEPVLAGCLAAVIDTFPSLPIVGYETGGNLATMRALGFEVLGPLRVWERTTTTESH